MQTAVQTGNILLWQPRASMVCGSEITIVYIPALQIYVDFHAESVQDLCVDYVDDQSDWNSIRLRLIFYYS